MAEDIKFCRKEIKGIYYHGTMYIAIHWHCNPIIVAGTLRRCGLWRSLVWEDVWPMAFNIKRWRQETKDIINCNSGTQTLMSSRLPKQWQRKEFWNQQLMGWDELWKCTMLMFSGRVKCRKGAIQVDWGEQVCENREKVVENRIQSCMNRLLVTQSV